jgi:hypothetical protein
MQGHLMSPAGALSNQTISNNPKGIQMFHVVFLLCTAYSGIEQKTAVEALWQGRKSTWICGSYFEATSHAES